MSKKKTNEEFLNEIKKINPCVFPLTPYDNSHSKMRFRCTKCGREWESYPYKELLRVGLGCTKCSYKSAGANRRKTNDQFVEMLNGINSNITPLDQYTTNKKIIKCLCRLCNNVWETTPDKLLRGIGCPNCYHTSTSFTEQFIYYSLRYVLGENVVLNRDHKAIGKELDIYIPSLKLAIEYGAWYWHKNRINKDFEKQKLCQEQGIKLILLFDNCDSNDAPSCEDCYIFPYSLSMEESYKSIKQIIIIICESYNLDYSCLQDNWDNIANLAYQKARKLTTVDFIKLVKEKNSHNIEVLGEYKSSYDAILCRCKDCGYEWSPRPNNLLNENAGCPYCAGNMHYTNQEFVSKVASLNPNFELLEPYTYSIVSILCRCKKCGYSWRASSGGLLKSRAGCPRCSGHVRYSNIDFLNKLQAINPNIKPLEPYPKNNKTKILFLCKSCGNRFIKRPNNVLSDQGCPNCSREKRIQKSIKDNETFSEELKSINPNIEPLEPYKKSKTKLSCKCIICRYEWKATPNSLLHGYGCPKCAKDNRAKKNEKKVLCIETQIIYDSLKEASRLSGLSNSIISLCCNGKLKTAGGYHWEYV